MEVSRCLVGQTPYISNVKVYDTGKIYDGALMMLDSAGCWSSGAPNDGSRYYFIIAAKDTNAAAIDTLGAVQEGTQKAYADYMNSTNSGSTQAMNIGSDYFADAAISAGSNFLPVCISPEVMYFAEYFQRADDESGANVISANITASTSTTITITSLQDHLDGGFLFSTDKTSSTAYQPGQLRYITVSAATGACTIDSAMKVSATTDFILGLPPMCSATGLTDDAVGLCSLTDKTADDSSVGLCTGLLVFENYVNLGLSGGALERFRYWSHKGLDGLKGFRAYAEVVLTDQLWHTKPA